MSKTKNTIDLDEQRRTSVTTPKADDLIVQADTIDVEGTPASVFTFRSEEDRQGFIDDMLIVDPDVAYVTNIDPAEGQPDRYLVAIRTADK